MVRDLAEALREYKEPLGDLVSLEMGKIRPEGHGEVQEMIDICDFAVGLSRQLYGLTMKSERPDHRMFEQWHPLGIVGVITAFNFPVAVWSWNAAIAAVCGDPVLWKPSSQTPLCAVAVQNMANRVMADHGLTGIFNLVIGSGRDVGELLLDDPRVPLISFTGSTRIGRKVATSVAGRLGRTILELGGNNAIIVADDADLDLAVRAILFGAVGTAGQRCTTTRRIIMHRDIAERAHRPAGQSLPPGAPGRSSGRGHPDGAAGGQHCCGGDVRRPRAGQEPMAARSSSAGRCARTWAPTSSSRPSSRCPPRPRSSSRRPSRPSCTCWSTATWTRPCRLHNDVPQGLSSAIFTDSVRTMEAFLSVEGL